MSRSGRHCDSREDAWFDHVQEKRWANEGEYVSEYGPEDQEQEDYGVEDESFQMFTEDQLQEDCSAEELAILKEAWFSHVQENHWTSGCENEGQEQEEYAYRRLDFLEESFTIDASGGSCEIEVEVVGDAAEPSVVYLKQRAADMEAKVMELEARLLLEEAWLMEAEASAAAAKARTLELEGILEKQNKQIDELTESLDMMTAWVIEVVQPETSNCL